jgi:hypothetical protein
MSAHAQSVLHFGGFKVQGRSEEDGRRFLAQARALEEAGCFAVVLECIPSPSPRDHRRPARADIGIGAGPAWRRASARHARPPRMGQSPLRQNVPRCAAVKWPARRRLCPRGEGGGLPRTEHQYE